jgi:hypothetical protein
MKKEKSKDLYSIAAKRRRKRKNGYDRKIYGISLYV